MPEAPSVLVLRGESTALALAEAEALGFQTHERRGRLALGQPAEAIDIAAGTDAVLEAGGLLPWSSNEAIISAVAEHLRRMDGRVCVRVERLGGRMGESSTQAIARGLWGRLHDAGCTIDLEQPEHVLCVFLDATSQHVGWGWDVTRPERHGIGARRAGERPFFLSLIHISEPTRPY